MKLENIKIGTCIEKDGVRKIVTGITNRVINTLVLGFPISKVIPEAIKKEDIYEHKIVIDTIPGHKTVYEDIEK